jgi:hypothetical protein
VSKGKKDHVGIFLSEFGKHNFFMLVDPKKKSEVSSKYPHLYYISPTFRHTDFDSDQGDKYLVPSSHWVKAMDMKYWTSVLEVKVEQVEQLSVNFTPYEDPEKKEAVVAVEEKKDTSEYNEINPQHYKANGIESIDVVDAFFSGSFNLGNAFKYMVRCGKKPGVPIDKDLKKAVWYLFNELKNHITPEQLEEFLKQEIATKHIKS